MAADEVRAAVDEAPRTAEEARDNMIEKGIDPDLVEGSPEPSEGPGGMIRGEAQETLADRRRRELHQRIDNDFVYHRPPNAAVAARYDRVREHARAFAHLLVDTCPPSRELSSALTKLEECVMHANAGIARSGGGAGA